MVQTQTSSFPKVYNTTTASVCTPCWSPVSHRYARSLSLWRQLHRSRRAPAAPGFGLVPVSAVALQPGHGAGCRLSHPHRSCQKPARGRLRQPGHRDVHVGATWPLLAHQPSVPWERNQTCWPGDSGKGLDSFFIKRAAAPI